MGPECLEYSVSSIFIFDCYVLLLNKQVYHLHCKNTAANSKYKLFRNDTTCIFCITLARIQVIFRLSSGSGLETKLCNIFQYFISPVNSVNISMHHFNQSTLFYTSSSRFPPKQLCCET